MSVYINLFISYKASPTCVYGLQTLECSHQGNLSKLPSSHINKCTSSLYVVWITWPCNGDTEQCTSHRYPCAVCRAVRRLFQTGAKCKVATQISQCKFASSAQGGVANLMWHRAYLCAGWCVGWAHPNCSCEVQRFGEIPSKACSGEACGMHNFMGSHSRIGLGIDTLYTKTLQHQSACRSSFS